MYVCVGGGTVVELTVGRQDGRGRSPLRGIYLSLSFSVFLYLFFSRFACV